LEIINQQSAIGNQQSAISNPLSQAGASLKGDALSSGFLAAIDKPLLAASEWPQPVKRRRALLASNPPRNNRSEANRQEDDGAMKQSPASW